MFFIVSIISLVILFSVNLVFEHKGVYEKEKTRFWLSKIMHFLGGFFVAMFFSNLIGYPLLVITLAFLAGIFWEIGEYFWGIYKFKKSGTKKYMTEMRDTIEDLFFDILGAIVWILIICHCCFFVVGLK